MEPLHPFPMAPPQSCTNPAPGVPCPDSPVAGAPPC